MSNFLSNFAKYLDIASTRDIFQSSKIEEIIIEFRFSKPTLESKGYYKLGRGNWSLEITRGRLIIYKRI